MLDKVYISFHSSSGNDPTGFLRDVAVIRNFPEWVMSPEQVKSSDRIATFSLWTSLFWDGM